MKFVVEKNFLKKSEKKNIIWFLVYAVLYSIGFYHDVDSLIWALNALFIIGAFIWLFLGFSYQNKHLIEILTEDNTGKKAIFYFIEFNTLLSILRFGSLMVIAAYFSASFTFGILWLSLGSLLFMKEQLRKTFKIKD